MDEQSQLDLEQQELRSCVARNYAATAALVMVALLAFSIMLRVLTGQYDSQPTQVDTVGASNTYYYAIPDNIRNDTLFYDDGTNQDQWPFVQSPNAYLDQQVVISIGQGCDTKYQRYILRISGLTPYGYYRIQTDWEQDGTYGYGIGGYANKYGEASYDWYCDGAHGSRLPDGTYSVLVTDNKTGFATVVYLPVGYVSYGK